jgi:hypothetical protein
MANWYVANLDQQGGPGIVDSIAQILLNPNATNVVVQYMDSSGVIQTVTLVNAAGANTAPTWTLPQADPGFPANTPGSGVTKVTAWVDQSLNNLYFNVTYDDILSTTKVGTVALV